MKNYPALFVRHVRDGSLLTLLRTKFLKRLFSIGFISSLFRIKNNKIVFDNFWGAGFGCNPKYVAKYIAEHDTDFDLVWLIDENKKSHNIFEPPGRIRFVRLYTFKAMYELATARFWVDNCRKHFFPKKKAGQIYIQTWHGCDIIKKMEGDAASVLTPDYIRMAKVDGGMCDYLLSSYEELTTIYKRAFWTNARILESGFPRQDLLIGSDKDAAAAAIKRALRIPAERRIVLYAPTFRTYSDFSVSDIDFNTLRDCFCRFFKTDDVAILLRLHPNMVNSLKETRLPDFVDDASMYTDIMELLLISDVLITDYSGVSFDYLLLNRPVFLYVPDYDEYLRHDQGTYIRLEDMPFPMAYTMTELCDKITRFDQSEYAANREVFMKKHNCYAKPNASAAVYSLIKHG